MNKCICGECDDFEACHADDIKPESVRIVELESALKFIRDNIGTDRITGTKNPTADLMREHASIALASARR